MHLTKKLFPTLFLLCFSLAMSVIGTEAAEAAEFLTPEKSAFIYMDNRRMNTRYEGEKLKFETDDYGFLHLMSRSGRRDYLSFINTVGARGGVGYKVTQIRTQNPDMTFFEIIADIGAHGMNCGYWLIGKRDGKWVTFVSLDNLARMGYTVGEWHQILSSINQNGNGRFILTSRHEYMPPGAKYGFQRRYANDLKIELFWDDEAQWFGMRSL
ncbi:MAG: hypothetical protein LKE33_12930 [Acidaminococcus sp.]|jgi:hypothetical protein|nr:hypothetical protein [Acidaminococcus sp.]MCI2100707.1 hypothetical protein [Acidaminococcus sp.]MCI2115028.1 hypothetical protein [Acidaminococcus sp.]MCI2117103.1 hypothetical protein [Acidaminococcus sp.]